MQHTFSKLRIIIQTLQILSVTKTDFVYTPIQLENSGPTN